LQGQGEYNSTTLGQTITIEPYGNNMVINFNIINPYQVGYLLRETLAHRVRVRIQFFATILDYLCYAIIHNFDDINNRGKFIIACRRSYVSFIWFLSFVSADFGQIAIAVHRYEIHNQCGDMLICSFWLGIVCIWGLVTFLGLLFSLCLVTSRLRLQKQTR
jgi:hypothetical protein